VISHSDPEVQAVVDFAVAIDNNERTYTPEVFATLASAFSNLYVRDNVLGLALSSDDGAYELRTFIYEYATIAPDGERDHPAIVASILAHCWGLPEVSQHFFEMSQGDNEDNRLAQLFAQMLERGYGSDVKRLILLAVAE